MATKEGDKKTFTFDSVFGIDSVQTDVYKQSAYPIIEAVLDGYNGTIFAYGQTGSGKTHTMMGELSSQENYGILPNAIQHIFTHISQKGSSTNFLVRATFLELYNEEIRDLLSPDFKKLDLKEDANGVYVKDGSSFVIQNAEELMKLVDKGNSKRVVAATAMNATSSRSHSIFTITVESADKIEGAAEDGDSHVRVGKLHLVDLAGSERQSKTLATGDRLKEAAKINLSLSCLGNVIAALVDGKTKHIPYRDSKLTRLLQDSLGGNSKTCMIAACSPADYNFDETMSTLRYAHRAKQIKNKPKINEDPKDAMLREYQDEIKRLQEQLAHMNLDGDNIHDMTDEQLVGLQVQLDSRKGEILSGEDDAEEQDRLLLQLKLRSDELERERNERQTMAQKLEQMQSKLLVGGENLLTKAEEQERKLAQHNERLAEESRKQVELQRELEESEDQYFQMTKSFASLKDEAADKTAKLKQLWEVTMRVKTEIGDVSHDIARERDELLDTIRSLVIELKYKSKLASSYIPEVYLQWIEANSHYDEAEHEWIIPNAHLAGNVLERRGIEDIRGRTRLGQHDKFVRSLDDEDVLYSDQLLTYPEVAVSRNDIQQSSQRLSQSSETSDDKLSKITPVQRGRSESSAPIPNFRPPSEGLRMRSNSNAFPAIIARARANSSTSSKDAGDEAPAPRGLVNRPKHFA
eukprot:Partr_v1_DN28102_c0_g1_i2_m55385 putative Kinesin family member